jgi:ABC-2 type transport system permease protein
VLSVALSAMLGVGIGVLVRNQVAAVVGTLVWFFIVEPLITLVSDEAYKFTISQSASAVAGTQGGDYLGFWPAVLVLAGWAALFVAAGAIVDGRRDVT